MPSSGTRDTHIQARWLSVAPFAVIGGLAVVAAGLVSAATAFAPSYLASWAVAYLALVVGAAQLLLGLGRALLPARPPGLRRVSLEALGFNLGNAGVLTGQLLGASRLTVLGSTLLVAVLVLMFLAVRGETRSGRLLLVYQTLLALLLVSIPIGLLIARVRPS